MMIIEDLPKNKLEKFVAALPMVSTQVVNINEQQAPLIKRTSLRDAILKG